METKWKLFKIAGNAITGYFAGLSSASLGDSDLGFKLLQGLFGAAILAGIAMGRLLTDAGEKGKF